MLQDRFDLPVSTSPAGLSYDADNDNYLVVDSSLDEVLSLNIEGFLLKQWSTAFFGSISPVGICFIPQSGNYAILDSIGLEVYITNFDGILLSQFDISSFSTTPSGITYLPAENNFAITDSYVDEIFICNSSGTLLQQFDVATFGINSTVPTGIAYQSETDRFVILDSSLRAALSIDPFRSGNMLSQFSTRPFGSTSPVGIALQGSSEVSNLAIVDASLKEVFIVNRKGCLQARLDTSYFSGYPSDIAYDSSNNRIAITDSSDGEVSILVLPSLTSLQTVLQGDFDDDGDIDGIDLDVFISGFGTTKP